MLISKEKEFRLHLKHQMKQDLKLGGNNEKTKLVDLICKSERLTHFQIL